MQEPIFALVVHDRPYPFHGLEQTLRSLSIVTLNVRTCQEAHRLINQTHPDLVFTDDSLPDGTWADVVRMAKAADPPVNVIVVSSNQDLKLYLSTIEGGAYDFVLPPFEHQALEYIVQSAAQDARQRKVALAGPAVA